MSYREERSPDPKSLKKTTKPGHRDVKQGSYKAPGDEFWLISGTVDRVRLKEGPCSGTT